MATPESHPMTSLDAKSDYGTDIEITSEYGSEFDPEEETLIANLLTRYAASAPRQKTVVYAGTEEDGARPTVFIHSSPPSAFVRLQEGAAVELEAGCAVRNAAVEVLCDSSPRRFSNILGNDSTVSRAKEPDATSASAGPGQESLHDKRSPLERFRTKPKKPLSVTDLVSPAWCELQYWYVLTKFGRKPRTQAMRQGSKVHKVLEEQVHDIVPVRTESKEDRFGLKIWNTIQGLRTLRATGLTRELEVWGVVEGQLVNGVIDELSYTCPDGHLAQSLKESVAGECAEAPPKGQRNIAQMLTSAGSNASAGTERVVYLADVKTRGVKSVPAGASLRPTWMQLMLYRKLLEALAQNNVDADTIFARYDLQPLEPFTDTFVTEIGGVDGMTDPSGDENPFSALQDSEIESHRNLSALWSLMISEFSETMTTISDVLRAEFRWSRTGELIGSELFAYDTKVIESYIESEMSWWKGERDAVGVEVEEAFKCRACDFAEECSWRKTKVEEATEKHRLRVAERKKSAV